jgi:alpha-ketoglutarate-dependent taurine dioxygenase
MNTKLMNIIEDDNLSWNKSLVTSKEKFFVKLKQITINLILENRSMLPSQDIEKFKFLKDEVLQIKKILQEGCGFFIIDGNIFSEFSKKELEYIYSIISQFLGELYVQNIQNEKFVLIKDEGKSMKTGGRYHQTKEGGSYHTDSPQWDNVPDFIGLLCINPAKTGGINKFLSAYSIHNEIRRKNPNFLDELYEKFYFDKRGEYGKNESPTVFQPIFSYANNELRLRYLRNYINDGFKVEGKELTESQIDSLDLIDEITKDDSLALDYELKSGDMVFFNNHRILHGRTSFENHDDEELKRTLVRVWIKDNYM